MIRRDPEYWQRLRKDVRSNIAAGLAGVAVLSGTISVISIGVSGNQFEARANPLYWLLMIPMVWWVSGLSTFAALYVRSWKPVMAVACVSSAASLAVAMNRTEDWHIWAFSFVITVAAAAASLMVYRNSLVALSGPAR